MANKSTSAKDQKYPFFSTSLKIETKMLKDSHIVNDLKDAFACLRKTTMDSTNWKPVIINELRPV